MRRIRSNVVWFFANLLAGLRLILAMPVGRRSFHVDTDQALLLLLAAATTTLLMSYPFGAGPASFDGDAWAVIGARCLLVTLLYYGVARFQGGARHFLALAIVVFSAGIPLDIAQALLSRLGRSYRTTWTWFGYGVDSLVVPFVVTLC